LQNKDIELFEKVCDSVKWTCQIYIKMNGGTPVNIDKDLDRLSYFYVTRRNQ